MRPKSSVRVGVALTESESALLKYASGIYGLGLGECLRDLLRHLPLTPKIKHPAIAFNEPRTQHFLFTMTQEQVAAVDRRGAELERSRSWVLRSLLNHLTDISPSDVSAMLEAGVRQ